MKRRVVITGLGTVNPLGNSVAESWAGVREGRCGIDEITQIDTTDLPVKLAAEVKDFQAEEILGRKEARRMDRYTQLAMAAAMEAFEDSGLQMEQENKDRCAVIISSGIGGLNTIEAEHTKAMEKGAKFISPFFIPMTIANMAAGQIAIRYGFQGMCSCVVTACASSTNAIGDAFRHIRDGYAEVAMAGGAESCVDLMGVGGFASLKALSTATDKTRASIPFDAERGGFVLGEGGGVLVLEEYEHAKARGAKIYAELMGYGANCDAHHITAPLEDGSGAAKCMKLAMEDAQIDPSRVDYINAHGTSTHLNDAGETKAVHAAFGAHAQELMISSTKSMTGHLLGGSGAVEAIFTVKALQEGFVPATIGYRTPDPECDLDIVPNLGRDAAIKVAMSNSFGFGGHNASLVFAAL
ncbi:MAG: beta-ketoacyl-ACP synthase II [Lachnospiraceae bacterium]|nr:beta-ketoacyl-ACP synthase II [Lachnospiraceae bacterium]